MHPNEMPERNKVITSQNKKKAISQKDSTKGAYRRLLNNPDFKIFYNYLETCYNSYMESGGSTSIPKDMKDDLLREAATIYKIVEYIKRQAK